MQELEWAVNQYRKFDAAAKKRAEEVKKRDQERQEKNKGNRKKIKRAAKPDELDVNELAKFLSTLRQKGCNELKKLADALCSEDNPFAQRSKKYKQVFTDLRDYAIRDLPQDKRAAVCCLQWLKRLLKIKEVHIKVKEGNSTLLDWLLESDVAVSRREDTRK
ncbi:MAG: hypothetical protein AB1374_12020 [Bacillota bacterium]